MSYGAEIVELSELFFKEEIDYEEESKEVLAEEQVPEVIQAFLQEIDALENFAAEKLRKRLKRYKKAQGIKGKNYLCQFVQL